ncbi:MAG TPA: SurA N-terminal domain-containing protein, partial [Burkholderiales bacterium]
MTERFRLPPNAIAAAALVLLIAGGPAAAQIVGAAAIVNGAEISNLRLERHFDEYVKGKGRNITKMINPKVYKKLKREALDQLIDKELLWQEAQRRGITVSEQDVAAALKEQEAQYKTRDAYLRKLDNAGFDEKSYAEYVRREIAIQRCAETAFPPKPVTDADIHEYYVANPDKFTRPEAVRARHILI